MRPSPLLVFVVVLAWPAAGLAQEVDRAKFASPPPVYRPIVSVGEGGDSSVAPEDAARRALLEDGAGGVMFSPDRDPARERPAGPLRTVTGRTVVGLQDRYPATASPWLEKAPPGEAGYASFAAEIAGARKRNANRRASLGFLTPEWFAAEEKALELAHRNGRFATFYDEAGYPSGSANWSVPKQYHRKTLRRTQTTVSGLQPVAIDLAAPHQVLAAVAVNVRSGARVDLFALAKNGRVEWTAPPGDWRIDQFYVATTESTGERHDYAGVADYFDAAASDWFIQTAYVPTLERLRRYAGNTINMTFFDDVGIYPEEKTWSPEISRRFEQLMGRPAAPYYPALWDDIGPETAAARVGFFRARAELLGEGFPRRVTEAVEKYKMSASGHAPGNYDLQPTDMNGDPFKFYAYTSIPMVDVLFGHGFGRGGFKLISSISSARDLPITAAEAFTVYNSERGYRRMIELFARGINRFVTGAYPPSEPTGTPSEFNEWAGRASLLLQGGRHVADVALVFPIESLQAFYAFDAASNSLDIPVGSYAYKDADYQAVGEMLMSNLHRDFTFVHPDALGSEKLKVRGSTLRVTNKINDESYRVVLLPGGEVISKAALRKIKTFHDAGGHVIATSLLPGKSAEFGQDEAVVAMVEAMFGAGARRAASGADPIHRGPSRRALFLPRPTPEALSVAFEQLGLWPDVAFRDAIDPTDDNGRFGYLHKQKEGREIYYFGNSSKRAVQTVVYLRGRLTGLEEWDPHTGEVRPLRDVSYRAAGAETQTVVPLAVGPLRATFFVGRLR